MNDSFMQICILDVEDFVVRTINRTNRYIVSKNPKFAFERRGKRSSEIARDVVVLDLGPEDKTCVLGHDLGLEDQVICPILSLEN